jgi:hypothetical protein
LNIRYKNYSYSKRLKLPISLQAFVTYLHENVTKDMEIFEELLRNEISSYNFVARVNPKIDVLFAHPNKKDPATNFKFAN